MKVPLQVALSINAKPDKIPDFTIAVSLVLHTFFIHTGFVSLKRRLFLKICVFVKLKRHLKLKFTINVKLK